MKNVLTLNDKLDYGNLYFKDGFINYEFYLDKYSVHEFLMNEVKKEYDVDDEMAKKIAFELLEYYKLDEEIKHSTVRFGAANDKYTTSTENNVTLYLACVPTQLLCDAIVFYISDDDMNIASRIERKGVPAFIVRVQEGSVKDYWEKEALDIIKGHEIEIDFDFDTTSKIEFKNLDENTYKIYKKIREEQKTEKEKVKKIQDNMFENLMNDTSLETAGSRKKRLVRRSDK